MDITLHIGWNKTGSTALQVFLLQNAQVLARRHRLYYPREGLLTCAHHNVAFAFEGRTTSAWGAVPEPQGGPDTYVRDAVARAREMGCTRIVFSTEVFSALEPGPIARLAASVRSRADAVHVVAYVRRQDLLAESAYNMAVKWWGDRTTAVFDDYVGTLGAPIDFAPKLAAWADAFGRESLHVRRYHRDALVGHDIRTDFCAATGIGTDGMAVADAGVNDSLGPRTLEMMRVLNQLEVSDRAHDGIANRLLAYDATHRSPTAVLFEPEARRAYVAAVADGNRELASYGVDPADFVVADDERKPRNVRRLTPEQFTEIFSFLARGA